MLLQNIELKPLLLWYMLAKSYTCLSRISMDVMVSMLGPLPVPPAVAIDSGQR